MPGGVAMPYSFHTDDVVKVVEFVGALDDTEFRAYLRGNEGLLARRERYALVVDASRAATIDSAQRKLQAEWMLQHDRELRTFCVGIAFVITNPLVRGALTAISWLSPMPMPTTVTERREPAVAWCRARLSSS
jgi:hypothetical protein